MLQAPPAGAIAAAPGLNGRGRCPWGRVADLGPTRSRVWRQGGGRAPGPVRENVLAERDESRPGGYWPSSQHPGVAGAGQLGGGLGQGVLPGEGERERLDIHQAARLLQADLAAVDVVVDRIAVLGEEAQDGQQVAAMSAIGMTSSDPGAFSTRCCGPSGYGSPAGRYSRPSESLRCGNAALQRRITTAGVAGERAEVVVGDGEAAHQAATRSPRRARISGLRRRPGVAFHLAGAFAGGTP